MTDNQVGNCAAFWRWLQDEGFVGNIDVTYEIRGARGVPKPSQSVRMPDVPDEQKWDMKFPDLFGKAVNRHRWILAGGSTGGAITGALLVKKVLNRGLFLSTLGAIAGAALGSAITTYTLKFTGLIDTPFRKPSSKAPMADPRVSVGEHVTVMTYNMRGGIGRKGFGSDDSDLDDLAKTIERYHPDILLLQEVDDMAARSSFRDNLGGLAKRVHADSAVAGSPGYFTTGRWQGNAVLTFNGYKLESARNLVHPQPGSETGNRFEGFLKKTLNGLDEVIPGDHLTNFVKDRALQSFESRSTVDTIVKTPEGNEIRVLTGHYHGRSAAEPGFMERQEGEVARAVDAWSGPTLFGGDFNIRSSGATGEKLNKMLRDVGLTDAFTAVGVKPGDHARDTRPGETFNDIDRIYASKHFKATKAEAPKDALVASDHLPVVTEFDLVPSPKTILAPHHGGLGNRNF